MKQFTFDEDVTEQMFVENGMLDFEQGLITLYAVVCIGPEGGGHTASHGGGLYYGAQAALTAARALNANPLKNCCYLPLSVHMQPELLLTLWQDYVEVMHDGGDD